MVKTDVPMTSALCRETLLALAERYPQWISLEELTATVYGRPILAARMGQGAGKVLCSAAHHANEWITTPVLLRFMEELAQAAENGGKLRDTDARELLNGAALHFVPMVDPGGVDLVTGAIAPGSGEYEAARKMSERYPDVPFPQGWKANLLGVDLNLQYPAGWLRAREIKFSQGYTCPGPRDYVGRYPLSQQETTALAAYTQAVDPDLVLAWHTQGRVIYWQFSDYQVSGARELGEEFARVSGYALEDTPYSSSFAGYKDWFIQNFRRPGYTIEAGLGENPLPLDQFEQIYRDNLGILIAGAKYAASL